jgi:hypothetical protein
VLVQEGELSSAFERTKQRWHAAHNSPYVWRRPEGQTKADQTKRGDGGGSYGGCGSCGWGDEDFHSNLQHTTFEPAQVEDTYGTTAMEEAAAEREGRRTDEAGNADADAAKMDAWGRAGEQEAWATDAPSPTGEIMSDPWAAPSGSEGGDGGGDGGGSNSGGFSDGSSWGWGGDGGSDGSGGDGGGGCGGGCGGD